MRFDARAAKLLKPDEHIMVDGCPGLRLVASATRRTWTYRYKSPIDGRMRQVALGQWPAVSPAAAAGAWEALKAQRDAGTDPKLARKEAKAVVVAAKAPGYTVAQLCADYIAGHIRKRRNASGQKEAERLLTKKIGDLGPRQAASITRADAFALIESQSDTPVSTGQLKSELASAWDYALDAGRLPADSPNWWRLVMRNRLRSKGKKIAGKHIGAVKRVLSNAETGALIRWLNNFSPLMRDALTLYLWTCTRGSEILAMEAHEIGEESDGLWWTIPKVKTKNARHVTATDLRVPLVGRAAEIVRERLVAVDGQGFLFPNETKRGHTLQKTVQTGVHYRQPYSKVRQDDERSRLTVTHWAPHDLRRTGRTLLAAMGCPDSVAEAILGHVQPGIQGVYNRHDYDKERRQWLTALDVKLEELAASR